MHLKSGLLTLNFGPIRRAHLQSPPSIFLLTNGAVRWATSKAGGSTKNGRDSAPKYLGVKLFGGEAVTPGSIIVRQRGARVGIVESTATVAFGRDWTIFALLPGFVHFWHHALRRKDFVEVLRTPPSVTEPLKYPIVRLRGDWELPELLRLPADTPLSDAVRTRLLAYLRAAPPAQLRRLLPPGTPAIGRVDEVIWGANACSPANDILASESSPADEYRGALRTCHRSSLGGKL